MNAEGGAFAGRAYVLARRERGESDLSVALLLDDGSVRWTTARAAARSTRRFGASLSAFTRYRVRFARSGAGGRNERIDEATVDRAFAGVLTDLRRMGAAGVLSAVARELGGEVADDDGLFVLYDSALERLDDGDASVAGREIVAFVVATFSHAGHEIVRERCVRCGREAALERSVTFSSEASGVLCARCGGGPFVVRSAERAALEAVIDGDASAFAPWMLRWTAYMAEPNARRGAECITSAVAYWK
ncbi:MAG: DNA repair protein RecO [Myxococcales bacterium]|nr:DNA repair protein RecO [Myxococcales bacterium]